MRSMVEREASVAVEEGAEPVDQRPLPFRPGSTGPPRGEEGFWQTRPDVLIASVAPADGLLKDRFAAAQRRARRARP